VDDFLSRFNEDLSADRFLTECRAIGLSVDRRVENSSFTTVRNGKYRTVLHSHGSITRLGKAVWVHLRNLGLIT
jgi:hypothetical protein